MRVRASVCVYTLWLLWSKAQRPDAPIQQVSITLLSRQQSNNFMALSGKKRKKSILTQNKNVFLRFVLNDT